MSELFIDIPQFIPVPPQGLPDMVDKHRFWFGLGHDGTKPGNLGVMSRQDDVHSRCAPLQQSKEVYFPKC